MKITKLVFLSILTLFVTNNSRASAEDTQALLDTIYLIKDGALAQFKEVNNLYYLAPATATTVYAFENDKRLSDNQRAKKLRKIYDVTGDLGVAFNFPIIPISLYYLGKKNTDDKLINFSKEYMAAMYLTLVETGLISYVPSHERPNKENQSFWETSFRGKNSFPSGHIVPYSVLFFKTMQFYGPAWSVIPGVLTYFASMQRVREGRHYVSDVVGAFWLSAFASEGVRSASGYKDNSSFYRKYFEAEASLSFIQKDGVIGPAIVITY